MKLAEALQVRADLVKEIKQLETRLQNNVLVQEGEQPNENPDELFKQLDSCLKQQEKLIQRINLTNCNTMVDGKSLTDLIAVRDTLTRKIDIYRSVVQTASSSINRYSRTEIKILPCVSVRDIQKEIDKMSKRLRELDNAIQMTNWVTELQ